MVIAKVRNSDYYNYHYSSPVIGLHVPNRGHKLQDESISRISYKPLPYQKELATHTDENAVTKSLKHDCYLHTEKTTTKECYSALPKDSSAPVHAKQISANDVADSKQHTIKKMANNFRYASSVFVKPDKRTLEPSHTTYQRYFTPVSLEFLKDKQADLVRRDVNASSNPGVRLSDPEVRSEYKYRFVMPKDALKGASDWKRDLSGVRGCAKLNVTHNTITGDRFNTRKRMIGTAHHHDEYCPWPVERKNLALPSAIRNTTSSIPKGDPDKEYRTQSCTHRTYQNPSTISKDLRFNTLKETHQKTFESSFKYKSGEPDSYTTTTMEYSNKHDGKPRIPGTAWMRDASSLPKGDVDHSRVHKMLGDVTSRRSYVTPSTNSYQKYIDFSGKGTASMVQLGSPEFRPTSRVTTTGTSYAPYADLSAHQRIETVPTDKMVLTTCKDFARSSAMHEDFRPKAATTEAKALAHKMKNHMDFATRWGLHSKDSSYSTTHQTHFSNPDTRMYHA